jgi:transcriptional regulator with XRE-family HTH domain
MKRMNLQEWLIKEGVTAVELADRLGLHKSYISKLVSGALHPPLAVALDVYAATRGEVPLKYMLPRAIRPPEGLPKKRDIAQRPAVPKVSRPHATA